MNFFYAQNYQILYKVDFRPKKEKYIFKTEYMCLETINNSKSIFYNFNNKKDSINEPREDLIPYLKFTIIQTEKQYSYYGNFNDLYFAFSEPVKTEWKISTKTLHFKGYKVQEAKLELDGRKWTALFAPEIPIISGPYKFSGLPGLIVKICSEDGDYSFEMIKLTKYISNSYSTSFPASKYITVKKKKVETFIANFLKDPGSQNFKLVNSNGDQFNYKFSGKRDHSYNDMNDYLKEVIAKYDNPIDPKIYLLIF